MNIEISTIHDINLNEILAIIAGSHTTYELMSAIQDTNAKLYFETDSRGILSDVLLKNTLSHEIETLKEMLVLELLQSKPIYINGFSMILIDTCEESNWIVVEFWYHRYIIFTGSNHDYFHITHNDTLLKINKAICTKGTGLATLGSDAYSIYKKLCKDHYQIAKQLTI